jgi:hypothetical protein
MPSRTITGTIYHPGGNTPWAGARVEITLLAPFAELTTAYAAETITVVTGSAGTFSTVLAVPTTGTALYQFKVPNYATFRANIAAGASVDLTTLISVAASPVASTIAAIETHAAIEASTTVLGHVKVDGTTIISTAGVLSANLSTLQPLDSDLTAIAALTTTAYGRSLLETASAAAALTLIGAQTAVAPGRLKASGVAHPGLPNTVFQSNSIQAVIANQVRYQGFILKWSETWDQLICEVQATGTATLLRMAIYAADTDWQPSGAPILDAGTVDATGIGVKAVSINQTLQPGRYITALNANGTATLRSYRGDGTDGGMGIAPAMGAGSQNSIITATQTFGAFPTPGTVYVTAGVVAGNTPPVHVVIRRASVP